MLISFSGLDGAGKSTQIENVCKQLATWGCAVRRLAFWDDVVVLTRYREGFVHQVYKSERGIGAPGKPVYRRDKNVRAWYLTFARHALYLLDAISLRLVLRRAVLSGTDVIVMDRYIYDELANLPLRNALSRAFVRLVRAMVPRPDIAFLLDTDPEAAHARKPEYPVAFMRECRGWYFELARLLGDFTVVPPLALDQVHAVILAAVAQRLPSRVSPARAGAPPQRKHA